MAADQVQALQIFTALQQIRPDWGGMLVLSLGLDEAGCSLGIAALACGAAVLSIEPDPATARQAVQTGCCDFAVNTLDEALRILKNEVRQRHSVSVALQAQPEAVLPEIVRRGVLPDTVLLHLATSEVAATRALLAAGSEVLTWGEDLPGFGVAASRLEDLLESICRRAEIYEAALAPPPERAAFAAGVADALTRDASLQRITARWIAVAPRLFPRTRTLALWRERGA